MTRRRSAEPTRRAQTRRKADVHFSFVAPVVPATTDVTTQRAVALARVDWPLDALRRHVLQEIARRAPKVLRQLALVPSNDSIALDDWIQRTGIDAPWLRRAAVHTLALWDAWPQARGRRWDLNLAEAGQRIAERGRRPSRPSELLVRRDHVEWLIRRHVLREPYRTLTDPPETSRKAVAALARRLGLSFALQK